MMYFAEGNTNLKIMEQIDLDIRELKRLQQLSADMLSEATSKEILNDKLNEHKHRMADTLPVVYSDGNDYSHLIKSAYYIDPDNECIQCGSTLVTELEDKDICHDCGFVYT